MQFWKPVLSLVLTAIFLAGASGCGNSSSVTDAGAIEQNFLSLEYSKAVYSDEQKSMTVEAKLLITDSDDDPVPNLPLMLTVEDATFIDAPPSATDGDGHVRVKFSVTTLGEHRLNVMTPEGEPLGAVTIPVSVGLSVKNLSGPQAVDIRAFTYSVEACLTDDAGPIAGKVDVNIPGDGAVAHLESPSPAVLDGNGCTEIGIKATADTPLTIEVIPAGLSGDLTAQVSPPHNSMQTEIFDEMSQTADYVIMNPRIGLFAIDSGRFSNDDVPMSQLIMGEVSSAALPNPIGHSKVVLDLPNLVDPATIHDMPGIGEMALHLLIAYDDLDMNGTWNPDSEPLIGIQGTDMFLFTSQGWFTLQYTGRKADGTGQYAYPDITTTTFSVLIRNAEVNGALFSVSIDKNDVENTILGLGEGTIGVALYLVPPSVLNDMDHSGDNKDGDPVQYPNIIDEIVNNGLWVGESLLEIPENDSPCFAHIPLVNTADIQNDIADYLIPTGNNAAFTLAIGMAIMYHEDSNGNRTYWLLMDRHMGRTPMPFAYVSEVDPVFPSFITMGYMQQGIAGEDPDPSPHTYLHTGWTATDIALNRTVVDVHNGVRLLELNEAIPCGTQPGETAWAGMEINPNTRIYGKVSCPNGSGIDWSQHNSATLLNYQVTECWKNDGNSWKLVDPTAAADCAPEENTPIQIFDFNPKDKFMMFFKWDNQMFEAWPVSQYTVGTVID